MTSIDWDYWANRLHVGCEEACILSCGVDPRIAPPPEQDAEIRRRQAIAADHLGRTLPAHETEADRYYGRGASGVRLDEFRAWAEALPVPFTFPDGFPPAAAPETAITAADAEMTPKREKTLLRIIRALDALAELPERGAVNEVLAKLQGLGFESPGDDTIRDVLKAARALEPD